MLEGYSHAAIIPSKRKMIECTTKLIIKGKGKKESERERSKQIHKNKTSPNFGLQCMQMQN